MSTRLVKLLVASAVAFAVISGVSITWAYFTSSGSGTAGASVAGLSAPTDVAATSAGGTVTVTWTDSTAPGGDPVDSYHVERIASDNSVSDACDSGNNPVSSAADPTCIDEGVGDGTYRYRVTANWRSWTATSDESDDVTVVGDADAPTAEITFPVDATLYNGTTFAAGCSTVPSDICGTATDPAGVTAVKVSILSHSANKYWDGSAFTSASETFRTTTVTTVGNTSVDWTYALPTPSTDGGFTIHVRATDGNGNVHAGAAYADTSTFTLDVTAPSVTVNQAASQADPANTSPVHFTATFLDPVTGFGADDVVLAGTGVTVGSTVTVTGSEDVYDIAVSNIVDNGTSGTVVVTIDAGAAIDVAANPSLASTSTDNTVTYDATAPTVTIDQAVGQTDPTNGSTVNFTVVFSETVTGFDDADLTVGGTAGGTTKLVTGSGTTYNLAVSGLGANGTVTAIVVAGGVQDGATNGNLASTSTDNAVTRDTIAPTVTINQKAGQADPTNGAIDFTVVFSEPVVDFATGDVTLVGGPGIGGTLVGTVTGSGTIYNVSVSGMTGNGTITATVAAGSGTDSALNASAVSTSTDNVVTLDTIAPTVTINQKAGQADPTNGAIDFTVVFSEPMVGFTTGDVTLTPGAGVSGTLVGTVAGSGTTFNVSVSGMTGNGTITATVAAGQATDAAGNGNAASSSTDNTITLDTTAPAGITVTCAFGSGSNMSCTGAYQTSSGGLASLSITIFKSANNTVVAGPSAVTTATGGTWTYASSGLAKDTYYAKITQTDAAGNSTTVQSANFTRS